MRVFRRYLSVVSLLAVIRNPSIRRAYVILKKNESLERSELLMLQEEKLRVLLKYARRNSSYYRDRLADIDLDSTALRQEFDKIAISQKVDLIENSKDIQVKLGFRKFYSATSGTSGQRLSFFKSERWDSYHRASIARGYSWHGVFIDDFRLYFWGHSFDFVKLFKTRLQDLLYSRVRLLSFKENDFKRVARLHKKIVVIEGYSSVVSEFAHFCLKNKIEFPKLKLVKGTSEVIHETYRDIVRKAFNLPLVSEYGSAEAGIISFECQHGNNHVNMDNVLLEEIEGEVVVTNLNSFGFPIIRYSLGDYILLEQNKSCKCGLDTDIITEIKGRVGYTIYGKNSHYPSLILYNIFKQVNKKHNIGLNYYAVQNKVGELEIYLKFERVLNRKVLHSIVKDEFINFDVNDVELVFKDWVDNGRKSGKFRDFYPLNHA